MISWRGKDGGRQVLWKPPTRSRLPNFFFSSLSPFLKKILKIIFSFFFLMQKQVMFGNVVIYIYTHTHTDTLCNISSHYVMKYLLVGAFGRKDPKPSSKSGGCGSKLNCKFMRTTPVSWAVLASRRCYTGWYARRWARWDCHCRYPKIKKSRLVVYFYSTHTISY